MMYLPYQYSTKSASGLTWFSRLTLSLFSLSTEAPRSVTCAHARWHVAAARGTRRKG